MESVDNTINTLSLGHFMYNVQWWCFDISSMW